MDNLRSADQKHVVVVDQNANTSTYSSLIGNMGSADLENVEVIDENANASTSSPLMDNLRSADQKQVVVVDQNANTSTNSSLPRVERQKVQQSRMEDQDTIRCFICLESTGKLAPMSCRCKMFCHDACLQKWELNRSGDQCEVCRTQFEWRRKYLLIDKLCIATFIVSVIIVLASLGLLVHVFIAQKNQIVSQGSDSGVTKYSHEQETVWITLVAIASFFVCLSSCIWMSLKKKIHRGCYRPSRVYLPVI